MPKTRTESRSGGRGVRRMRGVRAVLGVLVLLGVLDARGTAGQPSSLRPFGTLQEQAEMQQAWLTTRLAPVLAGLMRRHGVDLWVVPMREYNEDPIFAAVTSPETFAARRR